MRQACGLLCDASPCVGRNLHRRSVHLLHLQGGSLRSFVLCRRSPLLSRRSPWNLWTQNLHLQMVLWTLRRYRCHEAWPRDCARLTWIVTKSSRGSEGHSSLNPLLRLALEPTGAVNGTPTINTHLHPSMQVRFLFQERSRDRVYFFEGSFYLRHVRGKFRLCQSSANYRPISSIKSPLVR